MNVIGPKFSDPELQEFFDKNGFVKIPLLTSEEADHLYDVYNKVKGEHESVGIPFISTSLTKNTELVIKVNEEILKVTERPIKKYVTNSDILYSNFLVKRNTSDSETNPHQDLTIVDEEQYLSFSVWIALEDTDKGNGAMRFLPGSHLFKKNIRANPGNFWKYNPVMDEIKDNLIDCPTKKGEALIFPHSIIHGSYRNNSDHNRLACVIALYPKEAKLINYYVEDPEYKRANMYNMNQYAYIRNVNDRPPMYGEFVKEVPYDKTEVNTEEFEELMNIVSKENIAK